MNEFLISKDMYVFYHGIKFAIQNQFFTSSSYPAKNFGQIPDSEICPKRYGSHSSFYPPDFIQSGNCPMKIFRREIYSILI